LGFVDNGIDLELAFWINEPKLGAGSVRSDLNLEIWRMFNDGRLAAPDAAEPRGANDPPQASPYSRPDA
jgi:hypothetical protein